MSVLKYKDSVVILNANDTEANWEKYNTIIPKGLIVISNDYSPVKFKIGTGDRHWKDLPYFSGSAGYSLSQIDTGETWIDGSIVYRKTIKIDNLPNDGQTTTIPHDIVGLSQVVCFKGSIKSSAGDILFLHVVTNNASYPSFSCDMNNIYISVTDENSSNKWVAYSGYITLEYTISMDINNPLDYISDTTTSDSLELYPSTGETTNQVVFVDVDNTVEEVRSLNDTTGALFI